MENTTKKAATALELLSKRLFEITPEEVKGAFTSVDVQLQKTKRGTGANKTIFYRATLAFVSGLYEIPMTLTQMEYVQICMKRNPNAMAVPDSLKLKAYILPVEYTNVNSITDQVQTSFQLKVILSDLVRKKIWLDTLQKDMWDKLVKLPFVKTETDADGEDIVADAL